MDRDTDRRAVVDPMGRYYTTGSDRVLDVKSLVSELEHLIDKLPRPEDPECPSRRQQPLTIRQLRAEQAEAIIRDYRAGATLRELGELHSLNRQAVSRLLKRAEVPPRRQGLTPTQIDEAVLMHRDGQSLARIGTRFGVDARTVRSRLIERGVAMRDSHSRDR